MVPIDGIKDSRVIDNELFTEINSALGNSATATTSRRSATFLVIHNTGNIVAYAMSARMVDGKTLSIGDIMPGSAVLIPVEYHGSEVPGAVATLTPITAVKYQIMLGDHALWRDRQVPPPVTMAWTPIDSTLHGIGRGLVSDDANQHTENLLRKSGR